MLRRRRWEGQGRKSEGHLHLDSVGISGNREMCRFKGQARNSASSWPKARSAGGGGSGVNPGSAEPAGCRAVPSARTGKAGEECGARGIPLVCSVDCVLSVKQRYFHPPEYFVIIGDKYAKYFKKHSSSSTNGIIIIIYQTSE